LYFGGGGADDVDEGVVGMEEAKLWSCGGWESKRIFTTMIYHIFFKKHDYTLMKVKPQVNAKKTSLI